MKYSLYEARITLIPKQNILQEKKTRKRKQQTISLTKIATNILNKILANQILQYIEMIIHHD